MHRITIIALILAVKLAASSAHAEEPPCADLLRQQGESLQLLTQENVLLKEKLSRPQPVSLNADELKSRMTLRLKEIAADVRMQRQTMNDFQGYVTWMSGNITGYSKYIEAGSVAAGFARILPIPYAGQAGMFAKFVSHFTLSLSAASKSITTYLGTSQQFVNRLDAMEKNPAAGELEIAELARFADEQLFKDTSDLQTKLTTTSDLSASALSFLESLNHYVGSGDEYWSKAKTMAKIGDAQKKEKSFLAESISNQKNRASAFNGKLKAFDETAKKDTPLIKGLAAYNELLKELAIRQAKVIQLTQLPAQTPVSAMSR